MMRGNLCSRSLHRLSRLACFGHGRGDRDFRKCTCRLGERLLGVVVTSVVGLLMYRSRGDGRRSVSTIWGVGVHLGLECRWHVRTTRLVGHGAERLRGGTRVHRWVVVKTSTGTATGSESAIANVAVGGL